MSNRPVWEDFEFSEQAFYLFLHSSLNCNLGVFEIGNCL